jgi:hypothetical protein
MKKAVIVILVVLLVIGGGVFYFTSFKLDGVIKQAIEESGSRSFGTAVTVGNLATDLKNGSLTISNITVANPPGYKNEIAFSLSGIEAAVDYDSFEIKRVIIDKPEIVIEEKGGETNFSEMLANMERAPAEPEPEPAGEAEAPPEIVIHHFRMSESRAAFESESLDRYSDLKIDEVELKNVRGTPGEVANVIAKEVIEEVVSEAAKELLKAKAAEKIDDLFNRD